MFRELSHDVHWFWHISVDTKAKGMMGPKFFRKAFGKVLQRVAKNNSVNRSTHGLNHSTNELVGAPLYSGLKIFLLYVVREVCTVVHSKSKFQVCFVVFRWYLFGSVNAHAIIDTVIGCADHFVPGPTGSGGGGGQSISSYFSTTWTAATNPSRTSCQTCVAS